MTQAHQQPRQDTRQLRQAATKGSCTCPGHWPQQVQLPRTGGHRQLTPRPRGGRQSQEPHRARPTKTHPRPGATQSFQKPEHSGPGVRHTLRTPSQQQGRLLIAGLITLAIFGSFVFGAVIYNILQALGLPPGLRWGLAVTGWIALVALVSYGCVSFQQSRSSQPSQTTMTNEQLPAGAGGPGRTRVPPAPTGTPVLNQPRPQGEHPSYREMLASPQEEDPGVAPEPGDAAGEPPTQGYAGRSPTRPG